MDARPQLKDRRSLALPTPDDWLKLSLFKHGVVRLRFATFVVVLGLLGPGGAIAQTRPAPAAPARPALPTVTAPPPVVQRPVVTPERVPPLRLPGETRRPQGLPDLEVIEINPGLDVISARIRNVGQGPAPASRAMLLVVGQGRSETAVPPLAPGASAAIRFRAPLAGSRFQIMVDPENVIAEADETNNRPVVQTVPGASSPGPPPPTGGVKVTTPAIQFTGDPTYTVKPLAAEVMVTTPAIQFTGDPNYTVAPLPSSIQVTTPAIQFTGNP